MAELVCITGIDGSGKSTLIRSLAQALPSVAVAGIWDAMEGDTADIPFRSKRDIDNYLCSLSADARLLFMAHALRFSVDKASSAGKKVVLLNGYYFKYFATELALGADAGLVKKLLPAFPVPARTIRLLLPPAGSAMRKERFSRYECGLAEQPSARAFIAFQQKTLKQWGFFNLKEVVETDATQKPEVLVQQVLPLIQNA